MSVSRSANAGAFQAIVEDAGVVSATLAAEIEAEKLLLGEFERYAGQCIAVRNHRVCASAGSWDDICAAVRGQDGVTLLEIPLDPYGVYIH